MLQAVSWSFGFRNIIFEHSVKSELPVETGGVVRIPNRT